jgi:hypothetical protein
VTSPLSAVSPDRRRRAARSAELLAVVLIALFVVTWVRPAPGILRILATFALAAAILLGLMSWGVRRTIKVDTTPQTFSAGITEADSPPCNCGHAHAHAPAETPPCTGEDAHRNED